MLVGIARVAIIHTRTHAHTHTQTYYTVHATRDKPACGLSHYSSYLPKSYSCEYLINGIPEPRKKETAATAASKEAS